MIVIFVFTFPGEVVDLDMEYIENWSFGLDIRILLKTVVQVLKHEGAE